MKITKHGEVIGGAAGAQVDVMFALAAAVFGVDADGSVTIPDDLTAAPTLFTNDNIVAEVNSKT